MRKEGWEQELYDYLENSETLSFAWGSNDCALWASSFVDAITGSEHATQWIGQYDSEETASALMQARGFANPEAIADSYLMAKPIKEARRGDLILFAGALGICDGRRSYVLTPDKGLAVVLTIACQKAWTV